MSVSRHPQTLLAVNDEYSPDIKYRAFEPPSSSSTTIEYETKEIDEYHEKLDAKPTPTPLPRLQVFILLLMLLSEPCTAGVLFPFINNLVYESGVTHGDKAKIGYYAGLIVSLTNPPHVEIVG